MVSAVIAYSDRIPLDQCCSHHNYCYPYTRTLLGKHFRQLLIESVNQLDRCGVDEIIVVNYGSAASRKLELPNAIVIHCGEVQEFSEWDAKWIGIERTIYSNVITTNADILINPDVVRWFLENVSKDTHALYQGTKGWLNDRQTHTFLQSSNLDYCRHEVLIDYFEGMEWPLEGIEPATWADRRNGVDYYKAIYGIVIWKHSGDFQAFNKDVFAAIEYPLGSTGWGWGDIELRIRAKEAGLKEYWEREHPVLHMCHPVKKWSERELTCLANMKAWGRNIDWNVCGEKKVSPPYGGQPIDAESCGTFCEIAGS